MGAANLASFWLTLMFVWTVVACGCMRSEHRVEIVASGKLPSRFAGRSVYLTDENGSVFGQALVRGDRYEAHGILRVRDTFIWFGHKLICIEPDLIRVVALENGQPAGQLAVGEIMTNRLSLGGPLYRPEFVTIDLVEARSNPPLVGRDRVLEARRRLDAYNDRQASRGLPRLALAPTSLDAIGLWPSGREPPLEGEFQSLAWRPPGGPNISFGLLRVERAGVVIGGMKQPWSPPYDVLLPEGIGIVEWDGRREEVSITSAPAWIDHTGELSYPAVLAD
jgi:hypothetical protein